tara:strand:- start:2539 stop:3399 length:861 start_codon:yes stop_codon:yes gene_type:complete
MKVKNIFKFCELSLLILVLSSCSIAGSFVYERLDNYLASYFKEFADFTKDQNKEIDLISEAYLDWFSENELPYIKSLIEDLKRIDQNNSEISINLLFEEGEGIFNRTNDYFEKRIITFSKGLNEEQINQISLHFEELVRKREEENKKEKRGYKERILDNYISGFERIGIDLRDDQMEDIKLQLEQYLEISKEWSDLRQQWIEDFIKLLKNRDSYGYESQMKKFFNSLDDLGNDEFRLKADMNEKITLEIINFVFRTADPKQMKSFDRTLDLYLKSINRILSKRQVK